MRYDFLIVGAGLYGSVLAHELSKNAKVLVIDKRDHVGGNIYTENVNNINVHKYGAHIFHTNNKVIWDYIQQFATFNRFTNSPIAKYKNELYSLPFNMYTFNKIWGVITPEEAAAKIAEQCKEIKGTPTNLEEQAISLVGRDVYEILIKGYTEKQWGRSCDQLPTSIIKRLPVRLTFDNNYFDALYQGIPIGGYTKIIKKMLANADVKLNVDYLSDKDYWNSLADTVIYTGPIDAFYNYCFGPLEYRSVRFETEILDQKNFQGNAVVNYTDKSEPYTRIIEHKWFEFGKDENGYDIDQTIISREYSAEWTVNDEPYYPINNDKNNKLYAKYKALSFKDNTIFGGRLGEYKYYDMDKTVELALSLAKKLNSQKIL
jgi:UDP-galactopyranose mutase